MIASSGLRLLWVIFVRSTAPDARGMSASRCAAFAQAVARAASGHAAAAPPSSVMNSRRLMGSPPQTGGRRLPHRYVKTLLCITAKLIVEWQRMGWTGRAPAPNGSQSSRLSIGAWHSGAAGTLVPRQQLPQILATRSDVLSPRMVRIIGELIGDWEHLDERIERVTDEIEALARAAENCRRLMTVPGIGPIIASAMVAAIGNGAAFAKGRDFAAWLGLVPKQMSTGDRTILGRITKRGNRYLRMLFIQGARAILFRPVSWAKHSFGPWLAAAARRLHRNVLATALANKLARIALTVLVEGRSYAARIEPRAA
jgi:ATP-dependent protease HslVU (ClpYQ) peptidase subunit